MKVNVFKPKTNEGELTETIEIIDIKRGGFYCKNGWQPLKYEQITSFKEKYVYYLYFMGKEDVKTHGKHISLNWFDNQRFLFLQNNHWLQKEENLRWFLNISLIIVGLYIAWVKG